MFYFFIFIPLAGADLVMWLFIFSSFLFLSSFFFLLSLLSKWAMESDVPIQPVIRAEDKKKIGDYLQMAPEKFRILGGVDWKHLDRSNRRYFELGVELTLEGIRDLKAQRAARVAAMASDTRVDSETKV